MQELTNLWICGCLCLLLVGCVTAVDDSLPNEELPKITTATEVGLVVSPNHPTAFLPIDLIPPGSEVPVLGADENAAWLLTIYDDKLGWMPTIFSRTNVATLKPAMVIEPLPSRCIYLGSVFALDKEWTSHTEGSVLVTGSIYRPHLTEQFENASLQIDITEGGGATKADYVHTPLTASKAVILFGFSIKNLRTDSQIRFRLLDTGNEPISFAASFFSNDCPNAANTSWLPVGKTKVPSVGSISTPVDQHSISTSPPESTRIQAATPTVTATQTPISSQDTPPGSVLKAGETWHQNDWELSLNAGIGTAADSGPAVELTIFLTSNKAQEVAIHYNLADSVTAIDNLGRSLKLQHAHAASFLFGFASFQEIIQPDETILLRSYVHVDSPPSMYVLADIADHQVKEVIVTVNIASVSDAKWRIEVPH